MKMDGQPNPADILKQQSEEAAAKEKEREKEKEKQKTKSDGSTGGDESDGKADEDWWLKPGAWNRNRETPFDSFFDNQQSDFDDQDAWGSSWREGQTVLPYPIDLSPGSTSSSNKRRKTLSERIPRVQPDSLDDSSNETLPPPSSSSSSTKLLSPLKANVSVHKLNLFRRFHEDSMDASMQYGHVIRLETPFKHFSFHEPVGGCNATTAQGGKETTSSNARRHKCRVATNAGFFNIQMPPMKKDQTRHPTIHYCMNGLISRDGRFVQKQHTRFKSQQFTGNVHFGTTSHGHFFIGYPSDDLWANHLRPDSKLPTDIIDDDDASMEKRGDIDAVEASWRNTSEVYVTLPKNPSWYWTSLVGGGLWLVRDGRAYLDESFHVDKEDMRVETSPDSNEAHDVTKSGKKHKVEDDHFIHLNSARTAIGHTKDGALIIVAVDGVTHDTVDDEARRRYDAKINRQKPGINLRDLTALLLSLGAENAINLDGGGSTTVVIDGIVSNYPSDLMALPNDLRKDAQIWREKDAIVGMERPVSSITCIYDHDEEEVQKEEGFDDSTSRDGGVRTGETIEVTLPSSSSSSSTGTMEVEFISSSTGLSSDSMTPVVDDHSSKAPDAELSSIHDQENHEPMSHLSQSPAPLSASIVGLTGWILFLVLLSGLIIHTALPRLRSYWMMRKARMQVGGSNAKFEAISTNANDDHMHDTTLHVSIPASSASLNEVEVDRMDVPSIHTPTNIAHMQVQPVSPSVLRSMESKHSSSPHRHNSSSSSSSSTPLQSFNDLSLDGHDDLSLDNNNTASRSLPNPPTNISEPSAHALAKAARSTQRSTAKERKKLAKASNRAVGAGTNSTSRNDVQGLLGHSDDESDEDDNNNDDDGQHAISVPHPRARPPLHHRSPSQNDDSIRFELGHLPEIAEVEEEEGMKSENGDGQQPQQQQLRPDITLSLASAASASVPSPSPEHFEVAQARSLDLEMDRDALESL